MGTPYTFDLGMSCHSTSLELFYFDENFRRHSLWVGPFTRWTNFTLAPLSTYWNHASDSNNYNHYCLQSERRGVCTLDSYFLGYYTFSRPPQTEALVQRDLSADHGSYQWYVRSDDFFDHSATREYGLS